jgi:hypothetical protein
MDKQQEQLETLQEIRSLMERSSRFISLSGFSGVIAGVAAIAGVVAAYRFLGIDWDAPGYYRFAVNENGEINPDFYRFFIADILIVLFVSLAGASLLTIRKARQQERLIWDATSKRLLINIMIPLITGSLFCLVLLYHGELALIAPATLIFYGLALLNASKYTLNDIRYLGIIQIITGLVASLLPDYALLFWAFGFGVVHIIYGITMYYKYEK